MCCFTLDVDDVSDTSIYARAAGDRQTLVYGMTYAAQSPLAMVLPLPVRAGTGEDGVRFIDLSGCPDFFSQLAEGFRPPRRLEAGVEALDMDQLGMRTLAVHEVGDYEASYVPTAADFARLDERFRLPADLWLQLGVHRDAGFAVFKLKQTRGTRVHPMALDFPVLDPDRLFFPTLHVHHRRMEPTAPFDHMLYCQPSPAMNWHLHDWEESFWPAKSFVRCPAGRALLDPDFPVWRARLDGERENRDSWLGAGGLAPRAAAA